MAGSNSAKKNLVEHGFIKKKYRGLYRFDEKTGKYVIADPSLGKLSESHAEDEMDEVGTAGQGKSVITSTGYPEPGKRYRVVYESFNMSMEETYFWIVSQLKQDHGFTGIEKIVDIFSASENSAFFGQSAQRLSIQQDRASGFLKGISEMVKQLFQIVRELRIIDERLEPYEQWMTVGEDGKKQYSKAADSTLKGIFSDFAENKGGQMQPGSIYHLAQTVGYASLPDLFFNTHVYDADKVDGFVDGMKSFNTNVKNVLKRKLFQFIIWKEKTHKELVARKKFQIRFLKQHWATIKMYMAWTKPYLMHIRRLSMNQGQLESHELISAFETSMTELEVLFYREEKKYHPTVLATFRFSTRPMMQYRQEYQQGPVHVGKVEFELRSYGWSSHEISMYKKMRDNEDLQLLGLVDESVNAAMEELADDLEKYINDEGKGVFDEGIHKLQSTKGAKPARLKKPRTAASGSGVLEPLTALFQGMWELTGALIPMPNVKSKKKSSGGGYSFDAGASKDANKAAQKLMWLTYKNYKKAHKLLAW